MQVNRRIPGQPTVGATPARRTVLPDAIPAAVCLLLAALGCGLSTGTGKKQVLFYVEVIEGEHVGIHGSMGGTPIGVTGLYAVGRGRYRYGVEGQGKAGSVLVETAASGEDGSLLVTFTYPSEYEGSLVGFDGAVPHAFFIKDANGLAEIALRTSDVRGRAAVALPEMGANKALAVELRRISQPNETRQMLPDPQDDSVWPVLGDPTPSVN